MFNIHPAIMQAIHPVVQRVMESSLVKRLTPRPKWSLEDEIDAAIRKLDGYAPQFRPRNRAERRAAKRAQRKHGAGYTKKDTPGRRRRM